MSQAQLAAMEAEQQRLQEQFAGTRSSEGPSSCDELPAAAEDEAAHESGAALVAATEARLGAQHREELSQLASRHEGERAALEARRDLEKEELVAKVATHQAEIERLRQERDAAHADHAAEREAGVAAAAEHAAAARKARADLKVLAKEIKGLREEKSAWSRARGAGTNDAILRAEGTGQDARDAASFSRHPSDGGDVQALAIAIANFRTVLASLEQLDTIGSQQTAMEASRRQVAAASSMLQRSVQDVCRADASDAWRDLCQSVLGLAQETGKGQLHIAHLVQSTLSVSARLEELEARVVSPAASPGRAFDASRQRSLVSTGRGVEPQEVGSGAAAGVPSYVNGTDSLI